MQEQIEILRPNEPTELENFLNYINEIKFLFDVPIIELSDGGLTVSEGAEDGNFQEM